MTTEKKLARATRSDGQRSRQMILHAAARLATIDGLDGLSIGSLAEHIGMSKSGLYAHFGSKEELQLATIETAAEIFQSDVVTPTESIEVPLDRITALFERFIDYLARKVFPGGCFFAAAAAEFDTHPGPVQQRILEVHRGWLALLEGLIVQAQATGQIDVEESPVQLAFELDAFLLMANMEFVLHDDVTALDRAQRAGEKRIAIARPPAPQP
jgi:AcrR family transcriptional regulator